nr:MAG TPA: hypothetical protein [Caudoviricetes sp.]
MKNYTVITNKETCTGLNWVIDAKSTLSEADRDFIAFFSPAAFFNDVICYHWAYDTKLPSGRWLENMSFSEDLKTIKALVL